MQELTPEQASKLEALKTEIESLSTDLQTNVDLFNEKVKQLWNDYVRTPADKLNEKISEVETLWNEAVFQMGQEPDTDKDWMQEWDNAILTQLDFKTPFTAASSEYNISIPMNLRFDGNWDLDIGELTPKPEGESDA